MERRALGDLQDDAIGVRVQRLAVLVQPVVGELERMQVHEGGEPIQDAVVERGDDPTPHSQAHIGDSTQLLGRLEDRVR